MLDYEYNVWTRHQPFSGIIAIFRIRLPDAINYMMTYFLYQASENFCQ